MWLQVERIAIMEDRIPPYQLECYQSQGCCVFSQGLMASKSSPCVKGPVRDIERNRHLNERNILVRRRFWSFALKD